MLERFSQFFACVLLVLIPLQGLAAANLSICNSLMQAEPKQANMPCHEGMVKAAEKSTDSQSAKHQSQCKAACATLCASLCAMTTLPSNIQSASFLASTALAGLPHQSYASITQPNLQRPPIFLS
jgi:roadblock/LC7 domain-containing protein